MPIGVFDSGLGGLSVLFALQRVLPEQSFTYFGDNANAPIGTRSAEEITKITMSATARLFERECRLVILACNTASAVALRQMQEYWVPADRRVLGVFVPMIEKLAGRNWADRSPPSFGPVRKIGLFATPATVASGAFERELNLRISGTDVIAQPCPGLVRAIEDGDQDQVTRLVQQFCAQMLTAAPAPAAVVLGCTHYPLVREVFADALPAQCEILSQPDLVADSLKDYLKRHPRFKGKGPVVFLTSGDPARVAMQAQLLTGATMRFTSI